jgi:nitroreductase
MPYFVAVNAVEDVEPGLYRGPELVRPGNLRAELLWASWDQDLARDAAFVVISAVDLDTLEDPGYREAQLDAGIVEGRLHIAAYALGFGATGMTFLDSEIEPLLGEPLASLLWTCVGVPAYRSTKGGRPGKPAAVTAPNATFTEIERPFR